MSSMTIRPIEIDRDAADVVALRRASNPTSLLNVASWVHRQRTIPARAECRMWGAVPPMLAVNRSLGYQPAGRDVEWLKALPSPGR
jgi:hypothetical protein